jgi:hypothetical protein
MRGALSPETTVRRQWAPWRTPWIWRKLRSRSKPHRGFDDASPPVFAYSGRPSEVGSFVTGALNQLVGGSPLNAMDSAHPGAFLAGQVADTALSQGADAVLSGWGGGSGVSGGSSALGSGGGGGGGGGGVGGVFDDLDEAALVILAVIAVAVFLIVAIPLGILAVELVFALLALLIGVALRMAHVRPWTILVRQGGVTTAAFSVTGWRSSRRVLVGLRQERGVLATSSSQRRGFVPPAAADPAPGPQHLPSRNEASVRPVTEPVRGAEPVD